MDLELLTPHADQSAYFHKLCRVIIGQQLAGKAAAAIFSKFELFIGTSVTPGRILNYSAADYRSLGLSWAKAKYILDLAGKVDSGLVQLNKLSGLPDSEVIAELVKVKGIGPWTAEMFLIFTLGREDVFSFGDLGLRRGFQKLYHLHDHQVSSRLKRISPRWSPFKSYASLALWDAADQI